MKIRRATLSDVQNVTKIHIAAFPGFFLTSLGKGFLRELYSGFLSLPSGIFLVAENQGQLIGFAAGTSDPESYFSELRKRRGVFFLLSAIPAVLRHPLLVMKKLYGALFYRGDEPADLKNAALLSSIGVLPEAFGAGVGRELLEKFEEIAFSHGAQFVYLTTDETGNDRVNAFYRKCGYREESRFLQQANRPMLRYVKTPGTVSQI